MNRVYVPSKMYGNSVIFLLEEISPNDGFTSDCTSKCHFAIM